MKGSFKVAAAGVITALSVILLALGSVIWVFSYTMPLLCGIVMIILTESFNKRTALLVYIAVSIISIFLLSDKESALIYILFFGYYPIIRLKPKVLSWFIKLLIFNVGVVGAELICIYIFGIPFDDFLGKWGAVILLVIFNLLFLVYDRLYGMLLIIYEKKYKSRFDRFLK